MVSWGGAGCAIACGGVRLPCCGRCSRSVTPAVPTCEKRRSVRRGEDRCVLVCCTVLTMHVRTSSTRGQDASPAHLRHHLLADFLDHHPQPERRPNAHGPRGRTVSAPLAHTNASDRQCATLLLRSWRMGIRMWIQEHIRTSATVGLPPALTRNRSKPVCLPSRSSEQRTARMKPWGCAQAAAASAAQPPPRTPRAPSPFSSCAAPAASP